MVTLTLSLCNYCIYNLMLNGIQECRNAKLTNLVLYSLQQRLRLTITSVRLGVWHVLELAFVDFVDVPALLILCTIEELLVLVKAASSTFRAIQIRPSTGKRIRHAKNEEDPVLQVVKKNRSEKCNCEVC